MLKGLQKKLKWLDPFTYVDRLVMPAVNPSNNGIVSWLVYIVFSFVFAWLLYSGLGFLLGTASPIVVVVSPSMEPVYFRGDAIVLAKATPESISAEEVFLDAKSLRNTFFSEIGKIEFEGYQAKTISFLDSSKIPVKKDGSIVVYFSQWRSQPIIHRAVAKIHAGDGVYVLTKGDSLNNSTIDQDCGRIASGMPEKDCITLYPLQVSELQGQALLRIPVVGCIKLWVLDNTLSLLQERRLPQYFNGIC